MCSSKRSIMSSYNSKVFLLVPLGNLPLNAFTFLFKIFNNWSLSLPPAKTPFSLSSGIWLSYPNISSLLTKLSFSANVSLVLKHYFHYVKKYVMIFQYPQYPTPDHHLHTQDLPKSQQMFPGLGDLAT